jgi:hypothetical protein
MDCAVLARETGVSVKPRSSERGQLVTQPLRARETGDRFSGTCLSPASRALKYTANLSQG